MCYKIKSRYAAIILKGVNIMRIKNGMKRFFITLMALVMICAVIPFASLAAYSDIPYIYSFLVNDMGLTPAAACGVLANIECESDFNYNVVGDNGTSYGICQWHNERFSNLKSWCAQNGYSYTSLDGQLNFMKYELTTKKSDTSYILDKLKAVENTADGAYRAGYDWCYYYERPANRTAKAENRGNKAKNYYFPKYNTVPAKNTTTTTKEDLPTIPAQKTYSIGDVNMDGKVNSSDALQCLEHSVGSRKLSTEKMKLADINKDGKVSSSDAFIVLKVSTGADSIKNYNK